MSAPVFPTPIAFSFCRATPVAPASPPTTCWSSTSTARSWTDNRLPPTETAIHLGVYRAREDVQAVGHGHPPMSTLFTMVDRPVIAMRNFGFRFIGMPIHPDPTHIRTVEQGAAVARTLGKHKYCLLRGHGSVVAVDGVQEVFLDSLEMEENARSTIQAASLGPLKPITPEEVELLKVSFARNEYRIAKTWEHYREKARQAGLL